MNVENYRLGSAAGRDYLRSSRDECVTAILDLVRELPDVNGCAMASAALTASEGEGEFVSSDIMQWWYELIEPWDAGDLVDDDDFLTGFIDALEAQVSSQAA